MKSVFLLWYTPELPGGQEGFKLLGVYSSRQLAEKQIEEKYRNLAGFEGEDEFVQDEFIINEYEVDQDDWDKGFPSVPNAYGNA
jgi:hypothetical protein